MTRAFARLIVLFMTLAPSPAMAGQAGSSAAPAQAPPSATSPAKPAAGAAAPAAPAAPGMPTAPPVAAVLQASEPQGFTYKPEGRRDPFVSLLVRGSALPKMSPGARAVGPGGIAVDELAMKGTLLSQGTYLAIVQGADNRTYTVRAGDRLLDGSVQAISQNSMLILQQVNDPLAPSRQREVRKTLRQTEEAK